MSTYRYDVFISYASEDRVWVEEHVLIPLKRCRTVDGRVPNVFFDQSSTGLQLGEDWLEGLANGIRDSEKFVAIYSRNYFSKAPCLKELRMATALDIAHKERRINPVLLDPTLTVDFEFSGAQFVRVDMPDWFARLCDALRLVPAREVLTLSFRTQPPTPVTVNNTLPAIEVEILSDSAARPRDVEVNLSAKRGELRGDLSVFSRNGVAQFTDLSFGEPLDRPISLLASADGCVSAASNPFLIVRPAPAPVSLGRSIHADGDPFFFSSCDALMAIGPNRLGVWSIDGVQLGKTLTVNAPIRFIDRDRDNIIIADWTGRVRIVAQDGTAHEWDFGSECERLSIPGAIALADGIACVGFWNGNIYRVQPGHEPDLLWQHADGIQALSALGSGICIVDLAGKLFLWEAGALSPGIETGEPCIHGMKTVGDSVILVGERHLLKYLPQSRVLLREPLSLASVRGVLTDVHSPIVCDVDGRGFRFNAGLTPEKRFHVTAGALPVSADHSGTWTVFRQPDGAHILMHRHQVVYTHAGPIAVSPDGRRFAIGENRTLRLLERVEIETLLNLETNG